MKVYNDRLSSDAVKSKVGSGCASSVTVKAIRDEVHSLQDRLAYVLAILGKADLPEYVGLLGGLEFMCFYICMCGNV